MSRVPAPADADRRWHGSTSAERTAERRRRLVDASFELLGSEGAAAVTVRGVTRTSGLSPKYFYESFPDRDALLLAVWDAQYAELSAVVEAAIGAAADDLLSRMRAAFLATAEWLEDVPARGRAMLQETIADALLRKHARRRLPEMVLDTAVRSTDGDLLGSLPPTKLALVVAAMSGAIVNLFLEWNAGQLDVSREELVDALIGISAAMLAEVMA